MSIASLIYLDAAGLHIPDYPAVLDWYKAQYRSIYGDDVYLEADSQDGQMLAIEAQAAFDLMQIAAATYNSFSPGTARGVALDRAVKTNGIRRRIATRSSVPVLLGGQVGAIIQKGQAEDVLGQKWNLPASVTIPPAGQILLTATADKIGAISAAPGTITKIATPTLGWQTVTNPAAAVEGVPVERDPELRRRQAVSTALAALTPLGAVQGALENLPGVLRVRLYENDTNEPDANGLPAKTAVCAVVEGGDLEQVAKTIGQKKTPGGGTYGSTSKSYNDPKTGIGYIINFFQLVDDTIKVVVTGTAKAGYTTKTAEAIKQEVADYINSHGIGEGVEYEGLTGPAYLNQPARLQPYKITGLTAAIDGQAQDTADITIAFNRAAKCTPADVTVLIA